MHRAAPWLVALLAVIGCGAMALRTHQDDLKVAELQTKLEGLELRSHRETAELRRKISTAEAARAAAEKKLRAAAEGKEGAAAQRRHGGSFSGNDLRKDPAYAALWRKQQLRNVNRMYGDALLKLNLPADELAKVKDLLIARNNAVMDAREAAQDAGMDPRTTSRAATDARNEVSDEIKALIGTDAYSQIQSGLQAAMMRTQLDNEVGVDFRAAGVSLTGDQENALSQIYGKVNGAAFYNAPTDPQSGLSQGEQSILDQASQFLTPAQIPIFHDYLLEEDQQRQYFRSHRPTPLD